MAILRVEPNIINSNGSFTMGAITANTVTVSGAILPTVSNTIDIGSPTHRFGTLYLAGNTIDLGGAQITSTEGNVSFNTNSGSVELNSLLIDFLSNVATSGPQGAAGYTGSAGVMGYTGSAGGGGGGGNGYTGSQGTAGYTGSAGVAGTSGSQGYTGSAGTSGSIGYTGSAGTEGAAGSQGYTGSAGTLGYTGSKGDTGLGFAIAKIYSSVAALTADTSPTGISAGQFAIIETGNANDADNSRLYLWNGSAYSYVSDLSGSQGITGPQGTTGFVGSQGSTGVAGGVTYSVVNNGASAYTIAGSDDPTLTLIKGFTYYFNIAASGHPFWIKTAQTTGTGNAYNSGVTNNGVDSGTVTFTVPFNAPATLYYICQFHGSMVGTLNIVDSMQGYTGSVGPAGFTGSAGSNGTTGFVGSIGFTGSRGGVSITTGNTAPAGPAAGDMWYNTNLDVLLQYLTVSGTSYWIDITGPVYSFGQSAAEAAAQAASVNTPPTVQYVLVAGGGGGGSGSSAFPSGGGGAGGYLTGNVSVSAGVTYSFVIGAGGGAATQGSSTTGFSLTAVGGGRGASSGAGGAGGSGGGAAYNSLSGGTATAGQGNNGGIGTDRGGQGSAGGGGGGAGGAGGNAGYQAGGAGGGGVANPIAGSTSGQLVSGTYYFAGGGGGAGYGSTGTTGGTGGSGGGGSGTPTGSPNAGIANTGGGGGANGGGTGASGGSGIVIVAYPSTYAAAYGTTGSPTVTTAGGLRIYTFTSSGSITI